MDDLASSPPWTTYTASIYHERKGIPALGTVVLEEVEAKAKEKLKDSPEAFMFAAGSAGMSSTLQANLRAFERYRIVPRMLIDATVRTLETTLFGLKHPCPILITPIGLQGIFSPDAELAPARAGQKLGVPFIMSTASSRSIEDVAEANGSGHRWFQLYICTTSAVTLSLLTRAKANGFTTLVLTVDTMRQGWRPADIGSGYLPLGHAIQVGLSDPVFMARQGREPILFPRPDFPFDSAGFNRLLDAGDPAALDTARLGAAWAAECSSGHFYTWDDLPFIRSHWDGPIVLKGIQGVQDAEMCLRCSVDGIVVSTHGGRQIDGTIGSLDALARIMRSPVVRAAQAEGKFTVLFDSGIRTGPDIFKAIAIGAQAVLVGRPWLYGSIVAGQEGVEQVLLSLLADLDVTLGLSGFRSLDEIRGKADEILVKVD
ncbi:oxidoreductase [Roridomyces roridus]|uniref:Oxidoreductase n=1 Tax=Roridomyces roridus TaxID=1738132 RepID=A0AAD7CCB0_9AGAR|nr:oxidoreductase [Roridomyces roridus]